MTAMNETHVYVTLKHRMTQQKLVTRRARDQTILEL